MPTANNALSKKYPQEMEKFDELLGKAREIVEGSTLEIISDKIQTRPFENVLTRLTRARGEFDALLFFAVSFGMLKSGKSTLVNLLAGRTEVSPTRFGMDTTLRPCLVVAGAQDEIVIFSMKAYLQRQDAQDAQDEQQKKCFHAVIDHLRGIIDEQALVTGENGVLVTRWPFHPDKMIKALCEPEGLCGSSPLITVVTLANPGGLLASDVALLDVPGLDSNQMDQDIQSYVSLLDRCDLLLFIQSTVSALNHEAAGMLKDLVKRSKNSPIWLVQNRFEAQPWRDPKKLEEQDSKLTLNAKKRLAESLNVSEKAIYSSRVNLGKAYDASINMNGLREAADAVGLLEESGFPALQTELEAKIRDNRLGIQISNSLQNLKHATQLSQNELKLTITYLKNEIEKLFNFRREFVLLMEQLEKRRATFPRVSTLDPNQIKDLHDVIDSKRKQWNDKMEREMNNWTRKLNEEEPADDFHKEIIQKRDELFQYGLKDIFGFETDFGRTLREKFLANVSNHVEFREWRHKCQEKLIDLSQDPLDGDVPYWNATEMTTDLGIEPEHPEKDAGKMAWWPWKKFVNRETMKIRIAKTKEILNNAIAKYSAKIKEEKLADYLEAYCYQLAGGFREELRERQNACEDEAKKRQRELNDETKRASELESLLDKIEQFRSDFHAKVKV